MACVFAAHLPRADDGARHLGRARHLAPQGRAPVGDPPEKDEELLRRPRGELAVRVLRPRVGRGDGRGRRSRGGRVRDAAVPGRRKPGGSRRPRADERRGRRARHPADDHGADARPVQLARPGRSGRGRALDGRADPRRPLRRVPVDQPLRRRQPRRGDRDDRRVRHGAANRTARHEPAPAHHRLPRRRRLDRARGRSRRRSVA